MWVLKSDIGTKIFGIGNITVISFVAIFIKVFPWIFYMIRFLGIVISLLNNVI